MTRTPRVFIIGVTHAEADYLKHRWYDLLMNNLGLDAEPQPKPILISTMDRHALRGMTISEHDLIVWDHDHLVSEAPSDFWQEYAMTLRDGTYPATLKVGGRK